MKIIKKAFQNSVVKPRFTRLSLIVLPLLLSGTAVTFTAAEDELEDEWKGQRVVNMREEPRHRVVLKDADLYVHDVQILAGDTSLPHTHDAAVLLTFISNGDGPWGGRVSSNTDYATQPYTHQVSNAGPNMFHIIALSHYGPGVADLSKGRPQGLTSEPQLENKWFRSYRVELEPGQETALQTHSNPSLVVQVSDGLTHVTRPDGITAELDAMGDWAWRDAGSSFRVRNVGPQPVSVVINEGRR